MITPVHVDPRWSVGGKPHGGHLLGLLTAPGLDDAHPHPLSLSAVFTASPSESEARVHVTRLRTGRRVATSRLQLEQDGEVKVEALLSAGTLRADAEAGGPAIAAPLLPPPEDCPRSPSERGGLRIGFLDQVELRLDPGSDPATGATRGWVRRADGADPTVLDLVVFLDALPPVPLAMGKPGWVPTVELTAYVRALPAPGWLRATQSSTLLEDGWVDEDCVIWDSRGRLVAQARQLATYRG